MLTLAVPMLGLRLGSSDAGNDPAGQTTRKAYDLIAQGFGKGFNGPLQVAVKLPQANAAASLTQLNAGLRAAPDVASVAVPRIDAAGTTAAIQVFPRSSPQSAQTTNLVTHLRNSVLPPIERATGTTVYIGGATASQVDFANVLSSKLPLFIGIVIALSALLLMIVFRSFVIPLQAAVMNVLSIGAALGIVQAVFERGWVFGIQPGPIDAFIPVMGFAIIFGLSMDYEVFLISRVHEEWQRTGDATSAIREGLGHTGRVITAAATVMVAVFGAFAISGNRTLELFGVMMASAAFLDAVVIRMIMLPAVLQLLGRRTWEFPRGLDRRLPRLAIEPPPEPNGPRAPRSKKPHDDLRRTVRPGARADHSPPPSARVRAAPARAGRRSARRARRPPRANPSAPDRSDPALVAGGSRRLWNAMIRVAFLDDHTAVRAGVQAILAREADMQLVGFAAPEHTLWPLLERTHPAIVVVDLHHPGRDGLALCLQIKRQPDPPAVLLYSAQASALAVAAAVAGADAIVNKSAGAAILSKADNWRTITLDGTDVRVRTPGSAHLLRAGPRHYGATGLPRARS